MPDERVAWTVLAADLLTPVAAFLKLRRHLPGAERNGFLLESIEGGTARGRYSVIGLLPDLIWRCRHGQVAVCRDPSAGTFQPDPRPATDSLRALIAESRFDLPAGLPPMIGGVFGYLGYDMVRQMEHLPDAPTDDLGLPEAMLLRPALFAVFDNVRDELTLAVPLRDGGPDPQALLDAAGTALSQDLPLAEPASAPDTNPIGPVSNFAKADFLDAIRRIQDYISAGDAFQVVPSQRFSAPFAPQPFARYRALRRINPAPLRFFASSSSAAARKCWSGCETASSPCARSPAPARAAPIPPPTARSRPTCSPTPRSAPST
jgi:anthranilate synthase component 1